MNDMLTEINALQERAIKLLEVLKSMSLVTSQSKIVEILEKFKTHEDRDVLTMVDTDDDTDMTSSSESESESSEDEEADVSSSSSSESESETESSESESSEEEDVSVDVSATPMISIDKQDCIDSIDMTTSLIDEIKATSLKIKELSQADKNLLLQYIDKFMLNLIEKLNIIRMKLL